MEITLTKKQTFKLEPYGKFKIKWKTRQGHLPNIIPVSELSFNWGDSMPMSDAELKQVLKLMSKGKTDILCDNDGYLSFYTRSNNTLVHVSHPKLVKYREDESFKNAVDNGDKFANVMLNSL